jgi:cytochrome c-type biogenesis protein CcmH
MGLFWIIASLLVLLALWFVLPPLLQVVERNKRDETRAGNVLVYRDQYQELESDLKNGLVSAEQYSQDKDELERRLLEDVESQENVGSPPAAVSPGTKRLAYGVGAAIPVAAIAFYFFVGNPWALKSQPVAVVAPFAGQPSGMMSQQQIAENVGKLAQRLEENPNDTQGWIMLGRSYTVLERFSDAAAAYERATKLNDKDADIWADYAEAQAMANGRRLAGRPVEALNRALEIDPQNQKALVLAGSAAFEAAEYQKAIDYWQKLLPMLSPNSEEARAVSDQLANAKELAAGRGSR